jgi:hypothetical protein
MPTARQLNAQHGLRVGTKSVVDGSGTLVDVGDISLLSTTDKTSLVDAVNEVEGNLTNITTADVAEDPGYLYYTDTRSRSAVSVTDAGGDGSLSYDSASGIFTYTGPSASEVRAHFSGGTGVTITDGTIAIGQSVGTTDNVTFANTTLTGVLYGPSQFVIDPAAQGDITGEVIVLGDLRVEGTTTTINSTTVEIEDKTVLLAKSATVPTDANGAGIEVAGSGANLLYAFTTDSWNPNKSLKGIDGDASSPTYSFVTDPGLGLYRSADNQVSLATNGSERFRLTDSVATLVGSVDLTLNRGTYGGTVTTATLTANRTYTLPNVSGTLVTTGDTGSVTSTMIADGTIVDADVSETAEIAVSKLADGSARQLLQTDAAGVGVEWTDNIDVPGTLDVTGIATFDTKIRIGTAETANEREVAWNTDEGTLDVQLLNGVITRIGQDIIILCRNNTVSSIPKGTVVMFNGTVGNSGRIAVAPMVANGTVPGYMLFGVTDQAIAAGEDGYVKAFGEIKGIDTNAYAEGTVLWCNPAVPGGFTATEPAAPNLKLPIAAVVSSGNNGIIMVRWNTGSRLRDLHDVESNGSTADGELLVYNASATRWENGKLTDGSISSTAEIAVSKLADGAARQLLQTDAAGTGVEWTDNVDIPGTLDVTGAVTLDSTLTVPLGSAAAPTMRFSGDTNTGIYSPSSDTVAISTNGTGRLFIDGDGDVGIGVSNPLYALHVVTSTASSAAFRNSGAANGQILVGNTAGDLIVRALSTGDGFITSDSSKYLAFGTNGGSERMRLDSSGGFQFKGAGTAGSTQAVSFNGSAPVNSLVIDSSGRVGLGTATPAGPFHIVGSGATSVVIDRTDAAPGVAFRFNGATNAQILTGTDGSISINSDPINALASSYIRAMVDGSEHARITSDGKLGLGTSAPAVAFEIAAATPAVRVSLASDSTKYGTFYNSAGTTAIIARNGASNGSIIFQRSDGTTTTTSATIDSSGRVGIGTTAPSVNLHVSNAGGVPSAVNVGRFSNDGARLDITVTSAASGDALVDLSAFSAGSGNSSSSALSFSTRNAGALGERARIDSSGRLLVGTSSTSADTLFRVQGKQSSSASNGVIQIARGQTNPASDNGLGWVDFTDAAGSVGASIRAETELNWGASDYPTRLVFSTTADGSASPTERLRISSSGQVNISGLGTAAAPALVVGGDTNSGIYSPSSDTVAISTNGTGRLFVASDGKIGVAGTPFNPLDVFGSATLGIRYKSSGSYAGIVADNTSSTGGGYFGCYQNGTQKAIFGLTGAFIGDTSADAGVFAETGQAIRFFTNGSVTEKARITDDGKLGLGTSSPSYRLHAVQASEQTNPENDAGAYWLFQNSSTTLNTCSALSLGTNNDIGTTIVAQRVGANNEHVLKFQARNSSGSLGTRMTLTGSGSLGIGTTAPATKLEIGGGSGYTVDLRLRANPADPNYYSDLTHTATEGLDLSVEDFGYADTRLRLRRGFIGVNTATPATGLDVVGVTGLGDPFRVSNSTTEFCRVDASGRLLVGTSSARGNVYGGFSPYLQLEGGSVNGQDMILITRNQNDIYGPHLILAKSRGTANTIVASGDLLGTVSMVGNDGSSFIQAARIETFVDGTPGANDMPGRLVFSTTADGASSPTERMRIDSSGRVGLGTSSPGNALHVAGNIQTGSTTDTIFTNKLSVVSSAADLALDASSANITLSAGGSERARIDSSGRLLVGVSSASTTSTTVFQGNSGGTTSHAIANLQRGTTNPGTNLSLGFVQFADSAGSVGAQVYAQTDAAWASGSYPGRLVFSTTADLASSPTERMRIDSSGRLGLGTTSPSVNLHISSSSSPKLRIADPGTSATSFGQSNSGLELVGGNSNTTAKYMPAIKFGSTDSAFTTTTPKFGAAITAEASEAYDADTDGGMSLAFWTTPNDPGTGGSLQQRLTILNSGNVGIGTAGPGALLDLAASNDGATGTTANNTLRFTDTDANTEADQPIGKIEWYSADTSSPGARAVSYIMSSAAGTNSGGDIRFGISANAGTVTEAARIDSSGRLGLGTSSPGGLLHVQGVSGTYPTSIINHSAIDVEGEFLRVGRTDSTARYHSIYGKQSATDSSNYLQFRVHDGSASSPFTSQATVMTLTGQGRVGIGTTSPSELLHLSSGHMLLSSGYDIKSPDNFAIFDTASSIDRFGFSTGNSYNTRSGGTHAFSINSSEVARIDSSGRLLVGTSSARALQFATPKLQVEGTGYTEAHAQIWGNSNDAQGGYLTLGKSRGAGWTVVSNNDILGSIEFIGADGTDNTNAATIRCLVDGTPGNNDMPGRLVFSTTADGASSPTERMRIDSAGKLLVGASSSSGNGELLRVAKASTGTEGAGINFSGTYVLADDASQTVTLPHAAMFMVTNQDAGQGGLLFATYDSATITIVSDPSSIFATSDTDGKLCVFKSGSSNNVTVKNRLGASRTIGIGKLTIL